MVKIRWCLTAFDQYIMKDYIANFAKEEIFYSNFCKPGKSIKYADWIVTISVVFFIKCGSENCSNNWLHTKIY